MKVFVVPYIGTWIETDPVASTFTDAFCRTLYRYVDWNFTELMEFEEEKVVPYIGTWIETLRKWKNPDKHLVVPYIGTWIETTHHNEH